MRTPALRNLARTASTLARLLEEAVAARTACPHAAQADELEQGKVQPDKGGLQYDIWFAKQASARADAYALGEIRMQFRRLAASFTTADSGAMGMTVSERVGLARRLAEEVGERRGRPKNGGKVRLFRTFKGGIPPRVRTDDAVSRAAGLGCSRRFRLAARVVDSGDAELIRQMDAAEVSIEQAARLAKEKWSGGENKGGIPDAALRVGLGADERLDADAERGG